VSRPRYNVFVRNLATARSSPEELVPQGTEVNNVTVVGLAPGAVANLHFGSGAEAIPVSAGQSWDVDEEVDGCLVALTEGVYMTNPAGGGQLTIVVSYGKPVSGLRTLA
jgi:hypothetical protein